jgi:multiple sugar transport system permease protein
MRPLLEKTTSRGVARHTKARAINIAIDVVLTAVCLLMILPLVFLVSNAFKTPQEMLA